MILNFGPIQGRRRLIAAAILRRASAARRHLFTATPAPQLGYEPETSKKYLREMEVYGGKANVLASEFRKWFESLWHGRKLAVTVVCLTLMFLFLFLFASTPLPREEDAPLGEQKLRPHGP